MPLDAGTCARAYGICLHAVIHACWVHCMYAFIHSFSRLRIHVYILQLRACMQTWLHTSMNLYANDLYSTRRLSVHSVFSGRRNKQRPFDGQTVRATGHAGGRSFAPATVSAKSLPADKTPVAHPKAGLTAGGQVVSSRPLKS